MIHEALLHKRQQWHADVPVIGMGHSFGAIVTLLAANQSPAVFDRLLLLDPIFLPPLLSVLSRVFRRTGLVEKTPMVKMTRKRRAHWPDRTAVWKACTVAACFATGTMMRSMRTCNMHCMNVKTACIC